MLALMVTGVVVHVINWRLHRNMRGPGWWVIGFTIHVIGAALMTMRGYIPYWMVIVYSPLLVFGYVIVLYGLARYNGRPFNMQVLGSCMTALIIGALYFTKIEDVPMARSAIHGVVLSIVLILMLNELRYVALKDGVGTVLLLVLAYALSIPTFFLPLAIIYIIQPGVQSPMDASVILTTMYLVLMILESMSIFGFVLMTAGRSQRELRTLAMTDVLTGLPNRRAFSAEVTRALEENARNGMPIGLSIIDVDHFKKVNDDFGHDIGDRVLLHIAKTIESAMRKSDFVARIGGEEFAMILRVRDESELAQVIERVRQCVEEHPADTSRDELKCTVSIGAAIVNNEVNDYDGLYNKADMALYKAKAEGRNLTVLAA